MHCVLGGSRRQGPWCYKLALGTWNVTSLMGKEPEVVCEVEKVRSNMAKHIAFSIGVRLSSTK